MSDETLFPVAPDYPCDRCGRSWGRPGLCGPCGAPAGMNNPFREESPSCRKMSVCSFGHAHRCTRSFRHNGPCAFHKDPSDEPGELR